MIRINSNRVTNRIESCFFEFESNQIDYRSNRIESNHSQIRFDSIRSEPYPLHYQIISQKHFIRYHFNHGIINDSFLTFNFSNCQLVIIYHSILFYFIGQNHVICNTSRSINMLEISFSEKKI